MTRNRFLHTVPLKAYTMVGVYMSGLDVSVDCACQYRIDIVVFVDSHPSLKCLATNAKCPTVHAKHTIDVE